MKKAMVMLLTLGTFVVASQTRVEALGGHAAYWPGDEANVALFPVKDGLYLFLRVGLSLQAMRFPQG